MEVQSVVTELLNNFEFSIPKGAPELQYGPAGDGLIPSFRGRRMKDRRYLCLLPLSTSGSDCWNTGSNDSCDVCLQELLMKVVHLVKSNEAFLIPGIANGCC